MWEKRIFVIFHHIIIILWPCSALCVMRCLARIFYRLKFMFIPCRISEKFQMCICLNFMWAREERKERKKEDTATIRREISKLHRHKILTKMTFNESLGWINFLFFNATEFSFFLSGEILKNKFRRLISIYYHQKNWKKFLMFGAARRLLLPIPLLPYTTVSFEEHGNFPKNSALRFHIFSRRRSAISRIFY